MQCKKEATNCPLSSSSMEAAATNGVMSFLAREGGQSQAARQIYNEKVSKLHPLDNPGRAELKGKLREVTPPAVRASIEKERPGLGAREGSVGSANRTNPAATRAANVLGAVGKTSMAVNVFVATERVSNSSDKPREVAKIAGGTAGGVLVGGAFGAIGGSWAGPPGAFVGGIIGGVGGGIGGETSADQMMNESFWLTPFEVPYP